MTSQFDNIRAYEGQEITQAVRRIFDDNDFNRWLRRTTGRRLPGWFRWLLPALLRISPSPLMTLDYLLVFPFLQYLRHHTSTGLTIDGLGNIPKGGAFFMTNHRDIILDAAFLSYLLRTRRGIRPYLGVGNNLFGMQWIQDLMRVCRCFAVIRNGGPREVMTNAQNLSAYIAERQSHGKSFWLAQREGRAKDGNDLTQPAVLKMLTLAHEGDLIEAVKGLRITPVAITYEYDPCDYLKAREMQLKRDDPNYRKTAQEDMLNMQTGMKGQKGKIAFYVTPCINDDLDRLVASWSAEEMPSRNDQLRQVAAVIDQHIHAGYRLAWTNTAAKTILEGGADERMEAYIRSRIDLIDIPNRDDAFLRDCILTMYANPAINAEKAL